MLDLNDPRWGELEHAYGNASDIPSLLESIYNIPSSENDQEPWFSIWSALAHQGDVYSASFAAVPHVISALSSAPQKADFSYFQFPAWVEICRVKNTVKIPSDLESAYFESLSLLPKLVAESAKYPWSEGMLQCALAAIAASKGDVKLAEALLELSTEISEEFMEWFYAR